MALGGKREAMLEKGEEDVSSQLSLSQVKPLLQEQLSKILITICFI